MTNEKYEFSILMHDKEIKYRKWKVKDKNKFMSSNDILIIREALVYDCLEDKNIVFTEDEYKYVLIKIRSSSLGDLLHYEFNCGECDQKYEFDADLNSIITCENSNCDIISFKDHNFSLSRFINNRQYYETEMKQANSVSEKYLIDFIFHIRSYNDNDSYSFKELNEIINDLDVDIFEEIIKLWENIRFRVNNVHDVQCPHCNNIEGVEFDVLPGFFPKSWTKNDYI